MQCLHSQYQKLEEDYELLQNEHNNCINWEDHYELVQQEYAGKIKELSHICNNMYNDNIKLQEDLKTKYSQIDKLENEVNILSLKPGQLSEESMERKIHDLTNSKKENEKLKKKMKAKIESLEYNTRILEKDLASEKNKTENLQQRIKDLSNMSYG